MTKRYRPCVGVMLLNADGLVFIGRRKPKSHDTEETHYSWQMPQGGIDHGEEPSAAARRELWEETNVRSIAPLAEAANWLSYDLPDDAVSRWRGKYAGQSQKWFAFRFTGSDSEINISNPADGAHMPEFDAWRWERPQALAELVVPFKRVVYQQVIAEFAPLFSK